MMKKNIFRTYLFVLFVLLAQLIQAQLFPVQVNSQLLPPVSAKLSDYTRADKDRIVLTLLLTDVSAGSRQVKLRFKLKNNSGFQVQSSTVVFGETPIILDSGVPLRLTNIDIRTYFELNNLSGITPDQYSSSLPDGFYEFCFEVIDYVSGEAISRETCTSSFVTTNDPPLLSSPENESVIKENNPQNIVFSWTPQHVSFLNIDYEFTLVELLDAWQDPQTAMITNPALYQTTTSANTLLYSSNAQPALLPNKKYAWRIRVVSKDGTDISSLFKNNAESQVHFFYLEARCEAPIGLPSNEQSTISSQLISWDPEEYLGYSVQYRKVGGATATWFDRATTSNQLSIYNLEPETSYEYRLGGQCRPDGEYIYSNNKQTFTTASSNSEANGYECGSDVQVEISNQNLIKAIGIDDVFTVNNFPVTIKFLHPNSTPEGWKGEGYVTIPYLADRRIKVVFDGIKINSDSQLIEGEVGTTYDPNWGGLIDVDQVIEDVKGAIDTVEDVDDVLRGGDEQEIAIDFEIEDITVDEETGEIIITGVNGERVVKDYDKHDTYVIRDNKKVYNIGKGKTEASEQGEMAEGGTATSKNTQGLSNKPSRGSNGGSQVNQIANNDVEVIFSNGVDSVYPIDRVDNDYERENYPSTQDAQGNTVYPIHKGVLSDAIDYLYAEISIKNDDIAYEDLIFKTVGGQKLETTKTGNTYKIALKGFNGYRREEAIITYRTADDKQKIVANFFIHHLANKAAIDVTLVRVNGASINASDKTALANLYKKAGVTLNINTLDYSLDAQSLLGHSKIVYESSGLLEVYPEDFKTINTDFKNNSAYQTNAYYVFVTNLETTTAIGGFMPKGKQFAYVFGNEGVESKGRTIAQTIAHELGHGVFGLEHPFKGTDNKDAGTDWLMDYNGGDELSQTNWATLGSDALKLYLFQKDEDNEYTDAQYLDKILQVLRCSYANNTILLDSDEFRLKGDKINIKSHHKYGSIQIEVNDRNVNLNSLVGISEKITKGIKGTEKKKVLLDLGGVVFSKTFGKSNREDLEKIKKYIFSTKKQITTEFNTFWESTLRSKIEKDESITGEEINKLRQFANCGAEELDPIIKVKLLKAIFNVGTHEQYEDIVLDLLENFKGDPIVYSNLVLGELEENSEFLQKLLSKVDNKNFVVGREDNFTRLINILHGLWLDSDLSNIENYEYTNFENTIGGEVPVFQTPRVLSYIDKELLPIIEYETPKFLNGDIQFTSASALNNGKKFHTKYKYFQPIAISYTDSQHIRGYTNIIPSVFFAGLIKSDNEIRDNKRVGLTLDLVLTFSGIGNVSKLRHLNKFQRITKVVIAGLEISSSALDIVFEYGVGCNEDDNFCNDIKKYNQYLQLGLLGHGILKAKFDLTRNKVVKSYKKNRVKFSKAKQDELDVHFGVKNLDNVIKVSKEAENLIVSITKNVKLSADDILELKKISIDDLKLIERVSDIKNKFRNVDFNTFEKTMRFNSTFVERAKSFELWKNKDWNGLYNFFHKNPKKLINGGWPPFDGFYEIEKTLIGSQIKQEFPDLVFDRFQTKYKGREESILNGGFASPVKSSEYNKIENVFTYDARALMDDLEEGTYYFKFRLKSTEGISFDVGEAIPWKTKGGKDVTGGAIQVKLKNMKFKNLLDNDEIDIIQQSRLNSGNNWTHIIEDTREAVHKILGKKINCD